MTPSPVKTQTQVTSSSLEFIRPDLPSKCTWHPGAKPGTSAHHHSKPRESPKILPNALHAIGNTPLIRLNKIPEEFGIKCEMLAKCEYFNAGGSVKDRIGLRMIEEAEREGIIKPGYTLIEPTSGNTGIGLALAAVVKGYKCTIVMPEKMSGEKVNILKALGAEITRTPTTRFDAPESHISVAQKINMQLPNSVILNQYRNPANPLAHYDTTAEEIIDQCDNKIDMIVMGASTGGTITGIGRKIKEKCPNCKVIGVDPYGSILAEPEILNETDSPFYEVEGIGIGYDFVPTALDRSIVDKWVKTGDRESFHMARMLIRKEGLLCGGSSGSVMCAALKVAKELRPGQRCVVLFPDGIRNYMTKYLSDSWMSERDFIDMHSEMSSKHWWWDDTISCLNLAAPLTILPSMSCHDAIDIMHKKGVEQLPVVDDSGVIKGMVTLGNVMAQIMAGKVMSTSLVSDILYTTFQKVMLDTTLGRLSRILDRRHFALVVQDLREFIDAEKTETKELVVGVVTQMNLISYITNNDCHRTKSNTPPPTQNGTDEDFCNN